MGPGDGAVVIEAGDLFDQPPVADALGRFLSEPGHHLALAFDGGRAVGFVTGVEMTHPDKGTEMFLYELGVDELARGRGVGTALVEALATRAADRGCYGMWVLTAPDDDAAQRTYRAAGAGEPTHEVMLDWDLSAD